MKSNKQRRAEIKARRLERAAALEARLRVRDVRTPRVWESVPGLEVADKSKLAHCNTLYGEVPDFYIDRVFTCRDCSAEEVWTAKQQKWWYESAQGSIYSHAVRCSACRKARRQLQATASAHAGANLLREEVARLRALAAAKPNAVALAEIDAALQSKWRSLRVVAIEVMGRWGGPEQVVRLKAFVAGHPGGSNHRWWEREAADAAAKALARLAEEKTK
ncbi:zinc-ribbon domain-containing protein [Variovorax sp. E3]|uniref:zinc-ribbon domain-containing protein n=1 Tax=Variovorax sp. E3 TaxID=1914993 RepID=UPI0018DB5E26|nr:zinc-ribbon domain-containing protein [Variovorax sp. E3]